MNPAQRFFTDKTFERFHADRSQTRRWPRYEPGDLEDFASSFVLNPFPTQEWCYFLDDALVDVVGGR